MSPYEIPGYAEAVEKEQERRDIAFLGLPVPLCGLPARQFNARHLILLARMKNPFITRQRPANVADVLQFVWIVSPEYCLDTTKRDAYLDRFIAAAGQTIPQKEIDEYLSEAFADAPAGAGGDKCYNSHAAGLVDILASQYHWSDDVILEMPLARVWQYFRQIKARLNPSAPQFNPSDRLISDALRKRMEPSNPQAN